MPDMKAYWLREKAEAETKGDTEKVAYTTWKLDPRATIREATREELSVLRGASLRFRDRNLENQATLALGYYTGD